MLEAIVSASITLLLSLSASFLLVRRFYNTAPAWIVELKDDLFEPQIDEKGEAYTKIDLLADRFAQRIFKSFRFSDMGFKSSEARLDKGLQNAVLDDVLGNQNPIIGMVLEQFPSARTYLMKHPQMVPQVIAWLQPILSKVGAGSTGGSTNPNPWSWK